MKGTRFISFLLLPLMLVMVNACATGGPKQTFGTVLGGVGGAALGSQVGKGSGRIAATAIGTLLGAFVGSEIGASMDRTDRLYAQQTAQKALEASRIGEAVEWRNPDSGHYGSVTPVRTYQTPTGQYCREFQQSINVGGKNQMAYGRACRMPDGQWHIVSQ